MDLGLWWRRCPCLRGFCRRGGLRISEKITCLLGDDSDQAVVAVLSQGVDSGQSCSTTSNDDVVLVLVELLYFVFSGWLGVPSFLGESDSDLAVVSFNFECLQSTEHWSLFFMTSGDLETSIVQWADDLVTNQQSLGQVETEMAALALSGIHVSLITDDQNGVLILWTDLDFSDFTFLQVVFSFDCDEVGVVDFGGGDPQSVAGES